MGRALFALALGFVLSASCLASAEVVHHTFTVQNVTVQKLCQKRVITGVNGKSPGPLVHVREGDTLRVHAINKSPYNITLHWHGVFQRLSGWADGPEYTTQCPIQPGNSYIYKFTITGQEGTLWWHAHVQVLRATVHGGLIIYPRQGRSGYPFPIPHKEYPIILGEWWNANVVDVENQALATGGAPNVSNAFLINGQPGDLYPCSSNGTYKLEVSHGKTYLLRIINAALNTQLFFKIASHNMTVVAVDASYTDPYVTDVVLVAPGQTTDALITADQSIGSYYMAARGYISASGVAFDNTTATGILVYKHCNSSTPEMPTLPAYNDTATAFKFNSNLTALVKCKTWKEIPPTVDENILMTVGLGLVSCGKNATCAGPSGQVFAASISNFSFQFPTKLSMLQAHFNKIKGIYNATLPNQPLVSFDYTNTSNSLNQSLVFTSKSTTVKEVKYNTSLQIVFQDTALVGVENHPMHIHGFNFHVLAQGFGNYNHSTDSSKFNLINPQLRNTIGVPVGGWAVIRFRADNPVDMFSDQQVTNLRVWSDFLDWSKVARLGYQVDRLLSIVARVLSSPELIAFATDLLCVWLMHCHLDDHLSTGLGTAIIVDNGGTPSSTLPPPPSDLPKC